MRLTYQFIFAQLQLCHNFVSLPKRLIQHLQKKNWRKEIKELIWFWYNIQSKFMFFSFSVTNLKENINCVPVNYQFLFDFSRPIQKNLSSNIEIMFIPSIIVEDEWVLVLNRMSHSDLCYPANQTWPFRIVYILAAILPKNYPFYVYF